MQKRENEGKKVYVRAKIEDWGTVTELTGTGRSQSGGDLKGGSVLSNGV